MKVISEPSYILEDALMDSNTTYTEENGKIVFTADILSHDIKNALQLVKYFIED